MMWFDGKWVKRAEVPVFSHSLNYASCVFETLRLYSTTNGPPAFFRLKDHLNRFYNSLRFVGFRPPISKNVLKSVIVQLVKKNHLTQAYVRMNAFLASEDFRVFPTRRNVSLALVATPLHYTRKSFDTGLSCCISSWQKPSLLSMPAHVKFSAHYFNGYLAIKEAKEKGFDEALMLDDRGFLAEATAQNVFLVKDEVLLTPSAQTAILPGITRDSIIRLSEYLGLNVQESNVAVQDIFSSDEVFLTGTATEIMPVIRINQKRFRVGHITQTIRRAFEHVLSGDHPLSREWLTFV